MKFKILIRKIWNKEILKKKLTAKRVLYILAAIGMGIGIISIVYFVRKKNYGKNQDIDIQEVDSSSDYIEDLLSSDFGYLPISFDGMFLKILKSLTLLLYTERHPTSPYKLDLPNTVLQMLPLTPDLESNIDSRIEERELSVVNRKTIVVNAPHKGITLFFEKDLEKRIKQ